MTSVTLSLTDRQHSEIRTHLFPGDEFEAVAILLCGRRPGKDRHRLFVRKVVPVPYDACTVRGPDRVTWSTEILPPLIEEAASRGWALVKIHGHSDYPSFSSWDDEADRALFPSVHAWIGDGQLHGSAIMMADGRVFGRAFHEDGRETAFTQVALVGDDLIFWRQDGEAPNLPVPEFGRRIAQSFGSGTFDQLRRLKVAVIGCSGTGSPVIEQLARNGVGGLVLVDPDVIEEKNLNRILNSTWDDAKRARPKVEVAARAIAAMGLGTQVEAYQRTLFDAEVVRAVADCDVVFGCMDSIDGRHLLNKLATFYSLPYFDLGVKLEADGKGSVDQVCGTVHYLKPGGSSLLNRRVYNMELVRAAGLLRTDPKAYKGLLEEGYIRGVAEDRPAVIQLNGLIASLAINEFLARLHPYRLDPNGDYATHRISLSHGIYEHEPDGEPCPVLARHVGRGDVEPLLDWPELTEIRSAA